MIKIKKVRSNVIFIFILFFSILLVNAVYAEDIEGNQTDNSFDSIQILIDNAKSGDSIYLQEKTYESNGTVINIDKDISIYGSKSADTILDAKQQSSIFIISENANVNFFDLTLVNGKTTANGGAIDNNGNLIIHSLKFINNTAYNWDKGKINGDGGAINNNGKLYVYNSHFADNYAYNGGAVRGYLTIIGQHSALHSIHTFQIP